MTSSFLVARTNTTQSKKTPVQLGYGETERVVKEWTTCPIHRYYSPIMASERTQRQIDRLLDEAEEAIKKILEVLRSFIQLAHSVAQNLSTNGVKG